MTLNFPYHICLLGVVDKMMPPTLKHGQVIISVTCEHSTLFGKRNFANVINVKNFYMRMLSQIIQLDPI